MTNLTMAESFLKITLQNYCHLCHADDKLIDDKFCEGDLSNLKLYISWVPDVNAKKCVSPDLDFSSFS